MAKVEDKGDNLGEDTMTLKRVEQILPDITKLLLQNLCIKLWSSYYIVNLT